MVLCKKSYEDYVCHIMVNHVSGIEHNRSVPCPNPLTTIKTAKAEDDDAIKQQEEEDAETDG